MNDPLLEKVKSSIDEEELKNLTLRLIRKPSQQTDQLEYDPEVKRFVSETLVNELKALGIDNVILDDMGNLICRIGNPDAKRKIFFLGYAMTHPASSMTDPFKGEIVTVEQKEAVRGRGVSEQKGSLAAMITAVNVVNKYKKELDGELIFAVSLAGETGRHDSIDSIRKTIDLKADLGVVGIGTNSQICQGNKGRVDVLVNVYGKSCHSSSPSEGINAIEGACLVVEKLKEAKLDGEHPKLGRSTLTSTSLKSFPDATHTIQNECRLVFDRRLLPGDDSGQVTEDIRNTIGEVPPYKIEVKEGPVTFPSEVEDDSIIIEHLSQAIEAVSSKKADTFYSNSAIDAGYLNKHNIPGVMYGPGNQGYWHTDNEILFVDDLLNGAQVYTYLAMHYLKS